MQRMTLPSVAMALVTGLALSQPVAAAVQGRSVVQTGANGCTLSIPTTDTKVRPRATGFRNEGTTSAFVICTINSSPGASGSYDDPLSDSTNVRILLKSMDGASHDVTCTGVNSVMDGENLDPNMPPFGYATPQYISKTVAVNDTGELGAFGVYMSWSGEDYGLPEGWAIPNSSGMFSITCSLPPQVSIKFFSASSLEDVTDYPDVAGYP